MARCLLLTTAVVTASLAGTYGQALAAQVTIVPPREASKTLSEDQLAAAQDVRDRTYTVRGGGESQVTVSGISLAALLATADVDPVFSFVEIERPGGEPVRLSRDQATRPGAFPEGPPLIHWNAQGAHFLRPSSGPDDENAHDGITASGGAFTIYLRSGALLEVDAKASKVRVEPDQPVTFTAQVERAGAGQRLDYSWTLDDGARRTGQTITHRFAKRGSYDVALGVTAPGDDAGGSDYVTVQVGKPGRKGPDRKGGGGNTAPGAPDSGSADGPAGAGPNGGSGASPGATAAPTPEPVPSTPPPARRDKPKQAGFPESLVEGQLLANIAKAPPRTLSSALRAARTGSPSVDDGLGVPAVAWSFAASLALLGLGAGIELRGVRTPRPS